MGKVIPPLAELLAAHPKKLQIKRTATDNNPPPNVSLLEGELAVEMGNPLRLWVGVPTALDSTGKKLIVDASVDAGHVKKSGDTMTGPLVLPGDPTVDLHATDKHYVDTGDAATLAAANAHADSVALAAVRFDAPQNLTTAQALQARQNIYAAPGDAMAYSGIQVNGSGEVNQRLAGASVALVSGTARYIVDGWRAAYFHAAGTAIMAAVQSGVGPPGFFGGVQVTSAGAPMTPLGAADNAGISLPIEGYRCQRLGWDASTGGGTCPLTACFFFYSNVAGTFAVNVRNGAGDRSYSKACAYPVAATWQFYKVTIPPPPSGAWRTGFNTSLDFRITLACGTTYQQGDGVWNNGNFLGTAATTNFFAASGNFVAVSGVTLLPGNDGPKDWPALANCQRSFVDEYPLCKRYYEKSFQHLTQPAQGTGSTANCIFTQAAAASQSVIQPTFYFAVSKRAVPTITLFNPQNGNALIRNVTRGSDWVNTLLNAADVDCFQVYGQSPSSSQAWDTCGLHWTAEAGL